MKKQVLFDLKAWLLVLLLLPLGVHADHLWDRIVFGFAIWLILIGGFYPHQWLIRRYANTQTWIYYIPALVVLLGVLAILWGFVIKLMDGTGEISYWEAALNMAIILFLSTSVSYAYKGIWLQMQMEKAKRRQLEAELNLLQSQVNPHFLFNTLNNIYAQNLSDHEVANDMIIQLADLMRYQTESSRMSRVKLKEEIDFLHNYISLEKKRLTKNIEVLFEVDLPANVDILLPPMLFVPFVENAFKHGTSTEPGSFIHIRLSSDEGKIIFGINNSLPQRKRVVQSTRTGQENVIKRLDILFQDHYKLLIEPGQQTYSIKLNIPTSNQLY